MNVEEPHYASNVSNSSDSDNDSDSEDDRGGEPRAPHVPVDDGALEPMQATSGRRRRRSDDREQDRDSRHPSQRIQHPGTTTSVATGFFSPPNPEATDAFRLHGAGGAVPPRSATNAARILAGLEHVSPGLIRRLKRVVGGDEDCNICLDPCLNGHEAEFAAPAPAPVPDTAPANNEETNGADPSPSTSSGTGEFTPPPAEGVIALPCAHVFHAACLSHWFVQPGQTTCPACRFDLDPAGVIWYGGGNHWPPGPVSNSGDRLVPVIMVGEVVRELFPNDPDEVRMEPYLPGDYLHAPPPSPQDDDDNDNDDIPPLDGTVLVPAPGAAPTQEWAPPPPPGPTLRDRVEQLERDARLRCCDVSCGVGPSDENPSVELSEAAMRVVRLGSLSGVVRAREGEGGGGGGGGGEKRHACTHTFHPSCLVSAQRAHNLCEPVLRGGDNAQVQVVCSLCRVEGSVPYVQWLAGGGGILPVD